MSSTYHTTEGIVLKKTPYGEADFLVRVLTKDFGKIELRARGARNAKSKLNSHLDFLDFTSVSFVKNGDRVPTIIDSEKKSLRTQENFIENAKTARSLDLLVPFEVKDAKLFSMISGFFSRNSEKQGQQLIESVIVHEGYGKTSALPQEIQSFIMKEWPATLENLK